MHERIAHFTSYLLATSPLWYVPWLLFPAGFGKLPFLMAVVGLLALLVFLRMVKGGEGLPAIPWRSPAGMLRIALLGMLAVATLSALLSGNSGLGFWGSQARQTGVVTVLHLIAFAFLLPAVLRTRQAWTRFGEVLLWSASVPALVAVAEALFPAVRGIFGEQHRFSAWFGNPTFLAGYLAMVFLFSLRLLGALRGLRRVVAIGSMFLCVLGVSLTGSRGGFLALAAGCGLAAIIFAVLRGKAVFQGKRMITGLVIVILLLAAAMTQTSSGGALSRVVNADVWLQENQPRLIGWHIAWQGFQKRPVLGWGTEQFQTVFDRFYNPRLLKYSFYETVSDKPHNAFLEILATQGAMGGWALLMVFVSVVWVVVAGLRQRTIRVGEAASSLGLLAGLIVFSLFLFDILPVLVVWYAALAFLLAAPWLEDATQHQNVVQVGRRQRWAWLLGVTACVASAGILMAWAVPASMFTSRALDAQDPTTCISASRQALVWGGPYRRENRLHLAYAFIRQETNGAWSKEQGMEEVVLLRDGFLHDDWTDDDFTSTFVLGQLLAIEAAYTEDAQTLERARSAFLRAQELSPGRQVATIQLARVMIMAGAGQEAVGVLQELVDQQPDVAEPYWYLGLAQAAAGQLPEAASAFHGAIALGRFPRTVGETEYAVGVLNTQAAWEDIVAIYQHVLSPSSLREPAPWHAKLAATYAQAGKLELAVMEAQRAAQLDPSFAAEAQAFIDALQGDGASP